MHYYTMFMGVAGPAKNAPLLGLKSQVLVLLDLYRYYRYREQ